MFRVLFRVRVSIAFMVWVRFVEAIGVCFMVFWGRGNFKVYGLGGLTCSTGVLVLFEGDMKDGLS